MLTNFKYLIVKDGEGQHELKQLVRILYGHYHSLENIIDHLYESLYLSNRRAIYNRGK